ncbi:MAG: hypothetical protein QXV17_11865 [Candidatus Micrarchaeaceae archaeon]
MTKIKVTLSVDKETLMEARSKMIKQGLSLSAAFERLLMSSTKYQLLKLAKDLGIEIRYISFGDVIKRRAKGTASSGKIIRAMRDERERYISRY